MGVKIVPSIFAIQQQLLSQQQRRRRYQQHRNLCQRLNHRRWSQQHRQQLRLQDRPALRPNNLLLNKPQKRTSIQQPRSQRNL